MFHKIQRWLSEADNHTEEVARDELVYDRERNREEEMSNQSSIRSEWVYRTLTLITINL